MVEFPLDPPLAKMLLIGSELGCSSEVRICLIDRNPPTLLCWSYQIHLFGPWHAAECFIVQLLTTMPHHL